MAFKKPFRSTPVQVGDVYREKLARRRRRITARLALAFVLIAASVFALGMMVTN